MPRKTLILVGVALALMTIAARAADQAYTPSIVTGKDFRALAPTYQFAYLTGAYDGLLALVSPRNFPFDQEPSYTSGVYDGQMALVHGASRPGFWAMVSCAEDLTVSQLTEIIGGYLDRHPESSRLYMSAVLLDALSDACGSK
jgi:hypothetical protein